MPISELNALLETLRTIMKEAGAQFRLRDIVPAEVSLVDRAANKRRFLTIKNSDGVKPMINLQKVDLPANIREGVEKTLKAALEQLIGLTKAVSDGEAVTAENAVVPEDFQKALGGVIDHLSSAVAKEAPSTLGTEASDKLKAIASAIATIAEAESPDSVTDLIGRLVKLSDADTKEAATVKALGELSIALSADPSEAGVLSADVVGKVQDLMKTLGELTKVEEPAEPAAPSEPAAKTDDPLPPADPPASNDGDNAPTAKTDEPADPPAEPATKTDEPAEPADPPAEPAVKTDEPATGDNAATSSAEDDELGKAFELITARAIEKAGAKMSQGRLSRMRSMLKTLADLVEELAPASKTGEPEPTTKRDDQNPPPAAPADPPADPPPPAAEPEEVEKMRTRIKDLEKKVSSLSTKPNAPASRPVEGDPGTGNPPPVPASKTQRKTRWVV